MIALEGFCFSVMSLCPVSFRHAGWVNNVSDTLNHILRNFGAFWLAVSVSIMHQITLKRIPVILFASVAVAVVFSLFEFNWALKRHTCSFSPCGRPIDGAATRRLWVSQSHITSCHSSLLLLPVCVCECFLSLFPFPCMHCCSYLWYGFAFVRLVIRSTDI